VKDANNCIQTDTFEIIEPQPLQLELSSPIYYNGHNILIPGGNNGYINAIVNGGTTPFDFNWSNGATTEDLAFVTAGTYSVIVTDVNGCSTIDSITLTQPMILEMPNAYSPNGDGFNDFFIVHGIESYPNNVFTVINRWGNEVYTKEDYANEWNGNNNNGGQVPDGTYFVILDINEGEIILKGYVDLRRSK
jgi:gliding motility-associated-like protein